MLRGRDLSLVLAAPGLRLPVHTLQHRPVAYLRFQQFLRQLQPRLLLALHPAAVLLPAVEFPQLLLL